MIKKFISNPKNDTIFNFIEKRLILIIILFTVTFISLMQLADFFQVKWFNSMFLKIHEFIIVDIANTFMDRDSTLITISAIFIGMYFTTFTLITTISSESAFNILNEEQFSNLINYIINAFIASFLYLVISLLLPLFEKSDWIFSFVSIPLLLYMLLSAFRFGWLIYLILIRDINKYVKRSEEERNKKIMQDRIFKELEDFLHEQKKVTDNKNAIQISKLLEERKKKK